jgi:probable F420-dependent oxidoreductase
VVTLEGDASARGTERVLKHDFGLGRSLAAAGQIAAQAEADGYAGVWSSESVHDPFFPLLRAAEHTRSVDLGTSIAVALTRNPVVLASTARDLQDFSGGRFILGLGTQTRGHITHRFGLEWSRPAARMREFVRALHAIWDCWNGDGKLDFEGEFYRHTLMTPAFNPGPSEFAKPRVFLAAVGPVMAQSAGEVADGVLTHSFLTPGYFRDILLTAIDAGLARAGRAGGDFEIGLYPHIVPLTNEADTGKQLESARYEIAFHASTPAYRPVLEHHGWGDLQPELNALTKAGRWDEISALIDDEMLRTFAIIVPARQVEEEVRSRFGERVNRVSWRFASDATTTRR